MSRAPRPQACNPISRLVDDERVPHVESVGGLDDDLETVLAGVTGAAHDPRPTENHRFTARVIGQAADVGIDVRQEHFEGPRALHGQHKCLRRHIVDGDVVPTSMLGDPIDDFQAIRRVDHEEIKRFEPVNQNVVENAPLIVGDQRIADLARLELCDVVGEEVVEQPSRRRGPVNLSRPM